MQDLKLKCLLNSAREVLLKLVESGYMRNFVLVGGSALALYLCHRFSEDLDFFTYDDGNFQREEIFGIIDKFESKEIVNISDEQIDAIIEGAKVTFFNAKWRFLKPKKIKNFNIATLEQIAIMKTNTLFLRAKYRDYYDLYFLAQHLSLRQIFELSKDILSGINLKLFITALTFIDDIEDEKLDYLKPAKKLSLKEIREFFEEKIKEEFLE
ncbi:nucleotidyl transferase AbiEii/AbiGii toxin family protein [Hippea sp. KM1]|uniref:nucleotidyl transferase AbiEii/AbiGii toxin family protein n=1 Tax=Hippea sp. KM1 TaxID=944481 RepID=UPI00046D599F|nr:nucleotidyl transferase AbiEii/AbiGii toxin family protein [Hippea sp. KM1]